MGEDMTEKYPDVIQVVKDALMDDVESCIIDSEVVAWDLDNSRILPFQVLSTRGRKNITIEDIKVQVCIMPFDCMLKNGVSLVQKDLETRRAALKTLVKEVPGKLTFAIGRDFDELIEEDIQAFLDESIAGSCEGLMLKTLNDNAAYMPSKRSLNWLKLKKDYIDGVGDSIDVVPKLQSMLDGVKQAFCEVPNFSLVTDALFAGHDGETLNEVCHMTLGIPVKPMLAKPSKGILEVVERLSGKRFTGEFKYDGERAQIHIIDRNTIKVYSRNSENMTEKYPDVIQVVKDILTDDCQNAIIDSEVVAWDVTNSRILPFQILSTRARKNI